MSALASSVLPPAAAAASDEAERRIAPRTKTLKRGKVLFNNNFSTFDCIVRNISATGALLALDEAVHLPKEFDLRIGEEKTTRPARLVYRRGPLAGIHFSDAPEAAPAAPRAAAPTKSDARPPEARIVRLVPDPLPDALLHRFRWF